MVFASLTFLLLFFPCFLAVYTLTPERAKNAVLLLASWFFYGWWSPTFLLLLIVLSALAWAGGRAIACAAHRVPRATRSVLVILIVAYVAILAWFKYANIVVDTVNAAAGWHGALPIPWQRVGLPIGLSFTVLQAISYFVDVYRRRFPAEPSLVAFWTYLAMFGHLVAGPIIRYDWIRERLAHRTMRWTAFQAGARRFMIGLSMKVLVADTLAPIVEQVFSASHPGFVDAWVGCLAYTLQLYFDFAGYSAMAIGIGAMLGFRFPENFNAPYVARNLSDFWRRWHISLSSWLRDYLYFPLGGSRRGHYRTALNLLVTMALAGLWHGADSWNFLYWGIAHGVGLCVVHGCRARSIRLPALPAHLLTLLFVMLAWTLFRAANLPTAIDMIQGQFGMHGVSMSATLRNALRTPVILAFALGIVWIGCEALQTFALGRVRVMANGLRRAGAEWAVIGGFLLSCTLVAGRDVVPFLYFQF